MRREEHNINDLITRGVNQFLGLEPGPITMQPLGGLDPISAPSSSMIEFLIDMKILVPKDKVTEISVGDSGIVLGQKLNS